jgi:hypothetical protein
VSIPGATGSSFLLGAAEVGANIQVVATASNAAGTGVADSAQVGPVADPPAPVTNPPGPIAKPTGAVAKPTISAGKLTGVPSLRAKLRFTLVAGASSTSIATILVSLPRGLSFSRSGKALSRAIVITSATGKKLKLAAKVHAGTLTITLKTAASKATITIGSPAISVTKSLARSAEHGQAKTLIVLVGATEAGQQTTRLPLKLGI